jgi:hypothetical protein
MTKNRVGRVKSLKDDLPPWADKARAAAAVVADEIALADLPRFAKVGERVRDEDLVREMNEVLYIMPRIWAQRRGAGSS